MTQYSEKTGRPRRYALELPAGLGDCRAAGYLAALDELSARLFDLIDDLPPEALDYLPGDGLSSIAMLTAHMGRGEADWISRLSGLRTPPDVEEALSRAQAGGPCLLSPAQLAEGCGRIRHELTMVHLARSTDIDAEIADAPRTISTRGVLGHLIWHWTYHSGQVGLLRMITGHDYAWRLDDRLAGPA